MVFLAMGTDTSHSLRMTLAVRCHSERRQKCCIRKQGSGIVTRSEESITRMTAYRLPHHSHRFFAALRMTSYGLPYHGHRHFTFASDDVLPSERRQKCRIRKQGSGNVTRSEKSITLMGSRIPYLWCCFLFSCI